jgi:hypothetical protein
MHRDDYVGVERLDLRDDLTEVVDRAGPRWNSATSALIFCTPDNLLRLAKKLRPISHDLDR